jgi:hypothetical protein
MTWDQGVGMAQHDQLAELFRDGIVFSATDDSTAIGISFAPFYLIVARREDVPQCQAGTLVAMESYPPPPGYTQDPDIVVPSAFSVPL